VGAGRTSLGLALSGALEPTAGTLELEGRPVRFTHPAEALAAGIGYLTEDRKRAGIVPGLPIWENVTLSTLEEFTRAGLLDERRRRRAAEADCARFTVRMADAGRPIRTLSGGNQQKALLARLMRRPLKVVVLDEPTRGVDVGARAEVYRIVEELLEQGLAVIVISSDLPELLLLCDRIVVMHEGRTVGELPRAEATQEAIMALATGEGDG
jgi:ABC-type sugar transport system ATPase subunit